MENILIELGDVWQGREDRPEQSFFDKALRLAKYIVYHQQPGSLMISGDNDESKVVRV
jgi:hypothetical protein